eukprot:3184378-Rhodomonas_salina.1
MSLPLCLSLSLRACGRDLRLAGVLELIALHGADELVEHHSHHHVQHKDPGRHQIRPAHPTLPFSLHPLWPESEAV